MKSEKELIILLWLRVDKKSNRSKIISEMILEEHKFDIVANYDKLYKELVPSYGSKGANNFLLRNPLLLEL